MFRWGLGIAAALLSIAVFAGDGDHPEPAVAGVQSQGTSTDILGDADCSGLVNSIDALQVLRGVAGIGQPAACLQPAGDTNCDGEANSIDALRILRFVAGLSNTTPDGCVPVGETLGPAASSLELIAEALQSGQIDQETAYKYQVFALFADSRLPDEYKGDDRDAGERMEILDAAGGAFDSFSPATQAELAPFFKRPEEPGSWVTQETVPSQSTAGVLSGDAPAVEWTTFDAVGGKAKVWAQDRYPGDAAKAQAVAAALTAKIWPETTGLMGKEPKTDVGIPNNGGSDAMDFYLVHAPLDKDGVKAWLGVARASDPKVWCQLSASYLLVDSNEPLGSETSPGILQTVVHEFFHAIQFNFPLKTGCWHPEYAWFTEASATWAEDLVYPNAQSEQVYVSEVLDDPDVSIDRYDVSGLHQYGAYILPFYLARTGGDITIQAIWQAFATKTSLAAIDGVVQPAGGFDDVWPDFALRNWNKEPVDDYQQWDGLNDRVTAHEETIGSGGTFLQKDIQYLGATYYSWKFTDEARSVKFTNTLKGRQHAKVWAIVSIDGSWREPEDWSEHGKKTFCRDLPGQNIDQLVIVISNTDWEGKSLLEMGSRPPKLLADADTCKAFEGSASTTFTTGDGDTVGRASTEDVRFEFDEEYNLPGSHYWTVSGTVNWTYEETLGNCTVSGSGTFPVNDREGSIQITEPDGNGERQYAAAGGPPPAHLPYTATMTCPDLPPREINPHFNWIWLITNAMSGHFVADDGHLRGTEQQDYGGGDLQIWEWDFAPAP